MAASGYGKRSAPDQAPRARGDFAHLPAREASIAAHLDRLPDGAAVDIKTLAKELPAYGQQAVASALKALSAAGHLRRFREPVEGCTQWVSRSYFSRTARDDAWWETFLARNSRRSAPSPAAPPAQETSRERARNERSPAYIALASLGCSDPRLTLSAAECAALEELAVEWFARGITPLEFARILTAGLPDVIHCPGAFTRKRLIDRLPPERPETAYAPSPHRVMECTGCGAPGRPEALPGGLCRGCRGDAQSLELSDSEWDAVHTRVSQLRVLARTNR
ncbi:hypothetical protein AF335_14075 [Streptomyces eurocidicus]|uniref:Uncharacterized protein n=1 Tax=Streptomyces eurocidicus TaxID=66423 RepID=A0A2N8NYQ1_STREU|nr:hypothetical protein [Streptomyces eurocidicus]MBB5121470.1 hypothetical protein [Streptomyces eurocidicus]PNE33890.1 hypothetical protein AF335_14075 [Streptomyces eurocidicus]